MTASLIPTSTTTKAANVSRFSASGNPRSLDGMLDLMKNLNPFQCRPLEMLTDGVLR